VSVLVLETKLVDVDRLDSVLVVEEVIVVDV
jgi:hypothetical protein